MSPERIVTESTTEPTVRRRGPGPGGTDPAVAVFIAVLVAALIGLLIWFLAARGTNDSNSNDNNPAPQQSNSQQTDEPQPTEEPSTGTTP